jgi:hypothetical protein
VAQAASGVSSTIIKVRRSRSFLGKEREWGGGVGAGSSATKTDRFTRFVYLRDAAPAHAPVRYIG